MKIGENEKSFRTVVFYVFVIVLLAKFETVFRLLCSNAWVGNYKIFVETKYFRLKKIIDTIRFSSF